MQMRVPTPGAPVCTTIPPSPLVEPLLNSAGGSSTNKLLEETERCEPLTSKLPVMTILSPIVTVDDGAPIVTDRFT